LSFFDDFVIKEKAITSTLHHTQK